MIIRYLTLENFGVFKGVHRFDLLPKFKNGKPQPIILLGGKNGAGKTSIFEGIRICLYGPKAFNGNRNQKSIQRFMLSKFHKNGTMVSNDSHMRMELEFEYSQLGKKSIYLVSRVWSQSDFGVKEHLSIQRNGQDLDDLDQSYWQDFLLELIPPGLTQLFFFDGEKIQRLAEEESEAEELASSIKSLLGLDIVERLQADLKIYSSKGEYWQKEDPLHQELQELNSEINERLKEKSQLKQDLGSLETALGYGTKKINDLENKLLSEGGEVASKRQSLIEQKGRLQEAESRLENELRELCSGLLPLSLVPHLCEQLVDSFKFEDDALSLHKSSEIKQKVVQKIESRLLKEIFWKSLGIEVTPLERSKICASLLNEISDKKSPKDTPKAISSIHDYTDVTKRKLISWVEQTLSEIPKRSGEIIVELEQITRNLHNATKNLEIIHEENRVQPLIKSIQLESKEKGVLQEQKKQLEEKVSKIENIIRDKEREEKKLQERILRSGKVETKLQSLSRVNAVLEKYSENLLKKKVMVLQEFVTNAFRRLARKSDMVHSIKIDPESFEVILENKQGRRIPKDQLSAGEKQIYAISLLWGLGQSSGRPLPIMIDTPLGRLDSDHRDHLVKRYFPFASHQVILFSTDTEIDQNYLNDLSSFVSRQYHLQYDDDEGCSKAEEGYFWSALEEFSN